MTNNPRDELLALHSKIEELEKKLQDLGNEYAIVCHYKERLKLAEEVCDAYRRWYIDETHDHHSLTIAYNKWREFQK